MIEYGGMAQNDSYNHNRHGQSGREFLLTKKRLRYDHRLNPSLGKQRCCLKLNWFSIIGKKTFNINVERFSSLTKLCRATALIIRFIEKLRKRTNLSGLLKSTEIS